MKATDVFTARWEVTTVMADMICGRPSS